jgi:hypothetical protein
MEEPKPLPPRRIVGAQVHHSVTLADASRYAANLITALESASRRSLDDELPGIIRELKPLVRRVNVARAAAELRLQMHQSDPDFKAYVDGDLPWPDENPEGFVPRCRCYDRCLFHDLGQGTEDDCNCDIPCQLHADEEAA